MVIEDLITQKLLENPSSIFFNLPPEEKDLLRKELKVLNHRKGVVVFREGERPAGFLCLIKGKMKIFKEGLGGREQIVRMVKPIEFVCYRAVLAEDNHRASAASLEDSISVLIHRPTIMGLIERNPTLGLTLIKTLATELGVAYYRTLSLTQKHIRGRLADSLLFLRDNYGFEKDGVTLHICLSREDIANLSNMTTSNAIRTLSAFSTEGIISISGRNIKLLDVKAIERICETGF